VADQWLLRREIRNLERRLYETLALRPAGRLVRVGGAAAALGGALLGLAVAAILASSGLLRSPDATAPATATVPAAPTRDAGARPRGRSSTLMPIALLDPGWSPGTSAYSPSFSRDGRSVLFHVGRQPAALMRGWLGPRGELRGVTPVIRDHSANYHIVESANGQAIAFDSDRLGTRGVYIAAADGSDPVKVTDGAYAALPAWSPNGRRLAFIKADAGSPRVWNVWVEDFTGRTTMQLTHFRVGQAWRPSWFPDSRRLAYSVEDRLVISDVETGHREVFASPVRGRLVRTPAVAPDGRRVVFQVYRDGVWLLDLKTRAMIRILADPTAEEFAWQPDGRTVAYHARTNGRWSLWQLPVPGGTDGHG
jgi:Tol biopolymer transport system component